jgi:hypothetical protein
MPKYDYVIERFKRYDAWRKVSRTADEYTFRAVWSSTRWLYRYGWLGALILLGAVFVFAYRQFPAKRVAEITLEAFGDLIRQQQAGAIELTVSACDMGIIGEIDSEQIYWVELGYSGARWTATHALPASAWAAHCRPPLFIQYQRFWLLLTATILLATLYLAANVLWTYRHWSPMQSITIRQQGATVIIIQGGQELHPATYEQLDARFNLPTDNISLRRVIGAAIGFTLIGILLSFIAAYII